MNTYVQVFVLVFCKLIPVLVCVAHNRQEELLITQFQRETEKKKKKHGGAECVTEYLYSRRFNGKIMPSLHVCRVPTVGTVLDNLTASPISFDSSRSETELLWSAHHTKALLNTGTTIQSGGVPA